MKLFFHLAPMRLESLILSGLALGASSVRDSLWTAFPACSASANPDWLQDHTVQPAGELLAQQEDKSANLRSSARRLQDENIAPGTDLSTLTPSYQSRHQIIGINLTTGHLNVNQEARLWNLLKDTNEEVHFVVVYGAQNHGKSTLASMLTCGLTEGNDFAGSMLFEAKKDGGDVTTEGVWASDPIVYDSRKYVVVEIQAVSLPNRWRGLSARQVNDLTTKMVALFSEVASQFLYVNDREASTLTIDDYRRLTNAFKTFRADLVRIDPADQIPEQDRELNIRSTNHPSMLMIPRGQVVDVVDVVNDTNLKYADSNKTKQDQRVISVTTEELRTLMAQNFEAFTTATQEQIFFRIFPVMEIDEWKSRTPWAFKAGAHCNVYKDMAAEGLGRCRDSDTNSPSKPVTYRMMIEEIIKQFHDHSQTRKITFNGAVEPSALTGRRAQGLLEASVMEINNAGSLPDTELWRVVMQERCGGDLSDWTDRTRGRGKEDNVDGTLRHLDDQLVTLRAEIGSLTEAQIADRQSMLTSTWSIASGSWEEDANTWFDNHPLMRTVRDKCMQVGQKRMEFLNAQAETALANIANVVLEKRVDVLEEENRQLAAAKEALEKELALANLQNNAYQYGIYAVAGIIVLIAFSQFFGGAGGICTACCVCSKDIRTRDHDQKIVVIDHTNPNGTEMAAPSQAVPMSAGKREVGTESAEIGLPGKGTSTLERSLLQERIEDLEDHILSMAGRLTDEEKKRLQLSQVG